MEPKKSPMGQQDRLYSGGSRFGRRPQKHLEVPGKAYEGGGGAYISSTLLSYSSLASRSCSRD